MHHRHAGIRGRKRGDRRCESGKLGFVYRQAAADFHDHLFHFSEYLFG